MDLERTELESAVEAILFALGTPVPAERLAAAAGAFPHQIDEACARLAAGYETEGAGLRLIRLEDRWQLVSAPRWGGTIRGLLERRRPDRLSPAAMETLAAVAYFQPITRAEIDRIRGVDASHSVALLLERELIAPCGTRDAPGRPTLYRTTDAFLRSFALTSLADLPPLPAEEEKGGDGP